MSRAMAVTFLGTSSGGGPSESRNCSSLVCEVLGDGSLWMVDCAEGTLRQFAFQPHGKAYLKANKVTKLFITHMHADHIMGIVPLLRNILFPPPVGPAFAEHSNRPPKIEIYGPAGIRTFVRAIMKMTFTNTADKYVVHELLNPQDVLTPCGPSDLHISEAPGQDILCSEDGLWKGITRSPGVFGEVVVDVGPIAHRDPCLGYVFREPSNPSRKIVILGDTHDPSAIIPLCASPSLLIHEATDAYIPRSVDAKAKRTVEMVAEKALARGHSTPVMAGAFAKKIGAQKLVLNHIGGRFPASNNNRDTRAAVMREIERQASLAWGLGAAHAAWDYMRVVIPAPDSAVEDKHNSRPGEYQLKHADPTEGIMYNNHDRKRRR